MFDLTGKCALVTGASGGIGESVAEALHGQGATVALSGTRREKLEEVAARLGSRVHDPFRKWQPDQEDESECKEDFVR